MTYFPATKYYDLKWLASRDFSVTLALQLGIRQFNMKLFKIRYLCYRNARIRVESIQYRKSANLGYDYKIGVNIST